MQNSWKGCHPDWLEEDYEANHVAAAVDLMQGFWASLTLPKTSIAPEKTDIQKEAVYSIDFSGLPKYVAC